MTHPKFVNALKPRNLFITRSFTLVIHLLFDNQQKVVHLYCVSHLCIKLKTFEFPNCWHDYLILPSLQANHVGKFNLQEWWQNISLSSKSKDNHLVENEAQPSLVCEHTFWESMSTQRSKVGTTFYTLSMCQRSKVSLHLDTHTCQIVRPTTNNHMSMLSN